MFSLSIMKYIFITAIRDSFYHGIFFILAVIGFVSFFFGGNTVYESQMNAMVYVAGTSRLVLVLSFVTFVAIHINRMFVSKELQLILSRPISRTKFLFSYSASLFLLMISVLVPLTLLLFLVSQVNVLGLAMWFTSMLFEMMMIMSFAILSSLIFNSAILSIMSTVLLYVLSRMMGYFMYAMHTEHNFFFTEDWIGKISKFSLSVAAKIIPRFDLYAQSSWLVYGAEDPKRHILLFTVQFVVYSGFIIAVSALDFNRKEF